MGKGESGGVGGGEGGGERKEKSVAISSPSPLAVYNVW
jgi:hypothetical protein